MNYYMRQKSENPINGIYKIVNNINGRVYVGRSDDIEARWKEHKNEFRRKVHFNKDFQNDWNIYGKKNFTFEVIEECPYCDRKYRELYYMFQFENVYNVISNKEKMVYNICNSLTDIKPKYNGLNFYYQVETKYKNSSLNWDLVIKYNKKTIVIFLHKYTFNLTKERLEYIDLQKNTTLIHRTLAYKDQLDDLNNNVISEVLNVLNN